jgi:hypothetical protein
MFSYYISMAPNANKKTFILENDDGKALGTFIGASPGIAAKKAATAGHTKIFLRETGVHDRIREYAGSVTKLSPPREVMIAGKPVKIEKESKAKFVKVIMKEGGKKAGKKADEE